jgi:hypothetical protein
MSRSITREGKDMKKTYEKPVLSKRGMLAAVTAAKVTLIWVQVP